MLRGILASFAFVVHDSLKNKRATRLGGCSTSAFLAPPTKQPHNFYTSQAQGQPMRCPMRLQPKLGPPEVGGEYCVQLAEPGARGKDGFLLVTNAVYGLEHET